MDKVLSAHLEMEIPFYDVDPMGLVWHGNYVKYLEDARCALMNKIGYSYIEMAASGYVWPIVHLKIKYIRPGRLCQKVAIDVKLTEYKNCIKMEYVMTDVVNGTKMLKAETMQMAVDMETEESCYASPQILLDKLNAYWAAGGDDA